MCISPQNFFHGNILKINLVLQKHDPPHTNAIFSIQYPLSRLTNNAITLSPGGQSYSLCLTIFLRAPSLTLNLMHKSSGAHLWFLQGRGAFLKLGHNFYFFQRSSDKLRSRVATLDLRDLKSTVFSPAMVPLGKI